MKRTIILSITLAASSLSFANTDMDLTVSCNDVAPKVENCMTIEVQPEASDVCVQEPMSFEKTEKDVEQEPVVIS